jgi:hypothetical protein
LVGKERVSQWKFVKERFNYAGKELVKERVSEGKSLLGKELNLICRLPGKDLVKGRVREGKSLARERVSQRKT